MLKMKKSGFTLMELMVVIAILAILVTIMMPSLTAIRRRAYKVKSMGAVSELSNAALQYKNATEYYPGQEITPGGSVTGSQMLAACLLDGINANAITSSSNDPSSNYIEYSKDRFAESTTRINKSGGGTTTAIYTPLDLWKSGEEMAILYYPATLGNSSVITIDNQLDDIFAADTTDGNEAYGAELPDNIPDSASSSNSYTRPESMGLISDKFGSVEATNSDSFLMLAPGLDRLYFWNSSQDDCDDITNYTK